MYRRIFITGFVTAVMTVAAVVFSPTVSAASDTSPPSAPGVPAAVTATNTSITLVWAPSSDEVGVTGYEIFRSPSSPTAFVPVGTSSMARFTDTGLSPGTVYLYRVRAGDAAGNLSAFSPIALAMTSGPCATPPPAPGNLTLLSIAPNVVSMRWGIVVPAAGCSPAGFDILRAPGTSGGTFALLARIGFTDTFSDTTVSPATAYRYQVRARSANDLVSGPSNILLVTTPSQGCVLVPPPAPGNLTAANVTAASVTLTWFVTAAPGCALTYEILRAPGASGGAFTQVGTSGGNSFTDTGLSPATIYRYQARTRDADGNLSPLSNTVTVTTGPTAGGCTATYRTVNTWAGAFQGEVVVTNTGTSPIGGWRVTLALSGGATITQIWGGRTNQTASPYTVTNETWNSTLAPNATTTFGFNANGSTGAASTCATA